MTPTTLLITADPRAHTDLQLPRELDEDERGHTYLTRLAIRHRGAVFAYCRVPGAGAGAGRSRSLRIFTDVLPSQARGW